MEIIDKNTTLYAEINQPNPLKWQILAKVKKNVFRTQTGAFKCRDFFNDVVAANKGRHYTMWSFNNRLIEMDKRGGLWVELSNIQEINCFIDNLQIINGHLIITDKKPLWFDQVNTSEMLIYIPKWAFKSTYTISLLTLLIRLSNYGHSFEHINDFFAENSPLCTIEGVDIEDILMFLSSHKFSLPKNLTRYWWWSGRGFHSHSKNTIYINNSVIHDCGCVTYARAATSDK